jgi:serine/threonine-protein kinase HipA
LNGKKNNLKKSDFLDYFGSERLKLNQNVIKEVIRTIEEAVPVWKNLIDRSFLSKLMQEKYIALLDERCDRLAS